MIIGIRISYTIGIFPYELILNTVEDTSVTLSSDLTAHPITTGEFVADHMYINPITMSFSGKYSLNDSNRRVFADKLIGFEKRLEDIKNNAYLCTIQKYVKTGNSSEIRFETRNNMVLTSISLKEGINSVAFTLSFTQVLIGTVQEENIKRDDDTLPDFTVPDVSNLTEEMTVLNTYYINNIVWEVSKEAGLVTKEFAHYVETASKVLAEGAIVGGIIGLGTAKAASLIGLSTPQGLIAVGIAVVSSLVVGLVKGIVEAIQEEEADKKFAYEQFKFYDDEDKDKLELQRYTEFQSEISNQIFNFLQYITVYSISEHKEQQVYISYGGNSYTINIIKRDDENSWVLIPSRISSTNSVDNIEFNYPIANSLPSTLDKCRSKSGLLFHDSNIFCYAINYAKDDKQIRKNNIIDVGGDVFWTKFPIEETKFILTNFDISELTSKLTDVIISAITRSL